jgi:mannose-6-phosphate isomerase
VKPEPIRIEPVFSERLWGSRSLAPLFPEKSNLEVPIGEAWLTGADCLISTGPFTGNKLGEAWREMPVEWRGTELASVKDFPLLLKFIFPTDKLSIQVHPDDAYAAIHEQAAGGRGKTEMWHIVSAQPNARLLLGMKPGATKETFKRALVDRTLESLLISWPVHADDTFFVPARTPHTIGADMVVFEVQEYSDLTYRVYDYGRLDAHGQPRELHIEKALEVMAFESAEGGKVDPLPLPSAEEETEHSLLAACRYFATERVRFSKKCEFAPGAGHFELLVILQGHGNLGWTGGAARYHRGECWLLPASLGQAGLHALEATTVIRTYVPDIAKLRTDLHREGIAAAVLAQVIHD